MVHIDPALLTTHSFSLGAKKYLVEASDLRLSPGRFPETVGVNGQVFYNDRVTKCDITGDIQSVTYKAISGSVRLLTIFND